MRLLKSIVVASLVTILSRVLGFVRDAVIARIFGVGMATDAFFIAFRLPNLLRRIFAEGAFSQVFIPILLEYKSKQGKDAARLLVSYVFGLLVLVLSIIIVLGILAAPWIIAFISPNFCKTIDKLILATRLIRIIFPYILLISLASLSGAILNTWGCFLVPAFAPSFLNISIIVFALFVTLHFHPPILALAWSVTVGGVLQFVYQLPHLKKIGMLVLPRVSIRDDGIKRIIKQMKPAILGISVNQISLIMNTIVASFLVSGSVSWMYYADRLMEFPSGVLGATLGMILLPLLSKSFSNDNQNEYCFLIDWGLRFCFLFGFPSAVALGILAKPLTISLFQYNKFTAFDALMTQKALVAYSFGLIGLIVVKVLAVCFYSRRDIKTPVKIAAISLIITQLMNCIFIGPLKHVGLPLSIGLGACINAGLLYVKLRRRKIFIPCPGWNIFFTQLLAAILTMSISLVTIMLIMPDWSFGTMTYRLLRLTLLIILGAITYFATLKAMGFKLKEFFILKMKQY